MEYCPHGGDWAHQTFAVAESIRMFNEGETRMCVTSPTGGGKSRIMQRLCETWVNDGKMAVVMSNRILLTTQLLRGLNKAGVDVGCRAAGFESWTNLNAPVQVISAQTEIARVLEMRRKHGAEVELPRGDLLLVDEAHNQGGEETVKIIDEYAEKYGAAIIGITATPLGISHIYKHLIVAGNNSELRKCGALVPAKVFEPCVMDLPKVRRSKTGVFSQSEMEDEAKAIWSQHVVGHVFDHWKQLNPDARPSLGMAPGVKESLGLAQYFWKHGINAAHVDAGGIFIDGEYKKTNDPSDRDEIFAMSKDGRCPFIWNRFVLREAIDLPWLWYLALATPIASLLSYIQVAGRVLRSHASKTEAIVADHCGVVRMHGSPNADRDEEWKQYFHEADANKITKDRHERLTNPENKEPEPITCPNCTMVRKSGSKCPNCGHEHPRSVRLVIQESGELKEATGDVYPKRKFTERPDTEKKWLACYFRMKNSKQPKTFSQAVALFMREHGYRPPENLPMMPKNRSDFSRRITSVSREDLHGREACRN